jgi:tetratricopeptide (TPR) repeat protein
MPLAMACAAGSPVRKLAYTPDALRREVAERVPHLAPAQVVVPHAVPEPLVARVRRQAGRGTSHERALRLVDILTNPDELGLVYDPLVTYTAEETLDRGRGSCLSLASLLLGLARGIGLDAYYLHAINRDFEFWDDGGFRVYAGHVAVAIRTTEGFTALDFAGDLHGHRRFVRIDDVTAVAHFYNNRGYQIIHDAQKAGSPIPWPDVLERFEAAAFASPTLAAAWNNVGIAYGRLGDARKAERCFRVAISREAHQAAPHANLGRLLLARGAVAEAVDAYREAARLASRSALAHYKLARALHAAGDAAAARAAARRALNLGDPRGARELLERLSREEDPGSVTLERSP